MRRVGLAVAGTLAAGLAVMSGTAFASSAAPAGMAGMQMPSGGSWTTHVGTTKGWYAGHTVTFRYTRNFFCRTPPASKASSRCEGGTNYTQTPASTVDPLYVIVPLGFTPPKRTLQCPAGTCIDHPHTIDLTSVLGSGTGNLTLPAHSHIVATANSHQSEWWNVDVVGVKSMSAWDKLIRSKDAHELQYLQRRHPSQVTGNIPTNLFLYFSVLR